MKTTDILIYAVVLWTLVESRHAGRLGRSLDVEGKRSNLTQKQQQEVIHADVLQHFTTTPSTASERHADDATPSFIKDVPFLPEDINVQSLKNDDHLRVTFNRRININKENPDSDSEHEQNKTLKTDTNDVVYFNYNQSGSSSSTVSEVLMSHSSYEHSSTSVVYDEDESEEQTPGYHPVVSLTTETSKLNPDRKNVEAKKKEKGKKEILDSVTVPTDANGAGKLEKPFKDSLINNKLKDKNKDSISEALDDRRSTTVRISSSSSISISDHDNNKLLSSLELLKINSPGANDKESVNQSVNSVINVNGVNNDSLKKPKVKNLFKKVQENTSDADEDNVAASSSHLTEDTAKNTVPVVNPEPQTTPSTFHSVTTSGEKTINPKHYPPIRRSQLAEATPTKSDLLGKVTLPSSTTVIKPSIAFKQQLANKLKGLEPSPTAPMAASEDNDESQVKNGGKSSAKFTLRKKPKLEHASLPEMNIPPTATAWTLASLKSSTEGFKTPQKPESSSEVSSPFPPVDVSSTPRPTTIAPVSRVKSFVPWSTRLLRNSSLKPAPTTQLDVLSSTENAAATPDSEVFSSSSIKKNKVGQESATSGSLKVMPLSSTTEGQSVIRTTLELERNISEAATDAVQSSPSDVMVRDQSSPTPQETVNITGGSTTEGSEVPSSVEAKIQASEDSPKNDSESQVVENVIEAKLPIEENETQNNKEEGPHATKNNSDTTGNKISQGQGNDNVNEVKQEKDNKSSNDVLATVKTSPAPEVGDSINVKNISEHLDPAASYIAVDGDSAKVKNVRDHLDPGTSDMAVDGGGEDMKSGEESEEDDRQNQTTTLPPIFEPSETTTVSDLDEDVEGESDREEEDLPVFSNKTNQASTENPAKPNNTHTSTISNPIGTADVNGSSTYVTSFDIVSKENATQVVTRTPSEGDINWYNVDSKQINDSVEETSQKPIPAEVTTTVAMETTIEPDTTTEAISHETTDLPEITDTVTTMTPTTSVNPTMVPQPTVPATIESDPDFDDGVGDPASCVRIVVHVSPLRLCHEQQQLRKSIAAQLATHDISWEQILVVSKRLQECGAKKLPTREQDLDVNVCFIDEDQEPSPYIRNEFLKLYTKSESNTGFPIVKVQMIMEPALADGFDNVLAAIILSVIAAICLVLLGILLVIIRKRQGRFNYGQRCTPVSLDDYSLDNISVYNSVRRKGALRASKRSYGNPGFDDPGGPSHPINFAGLANFSSDREALDEEFNQIPMITVKPDELPPGAESKNRYANVIPLPETRVVLHTKDGADPLDEYINANYVKGPKGAEKLYIACQAPLQSTVEDFWKMVWQQQTKVILMLTALNENGVEKCADYLPQLEITDCHRLFGDFQVTLKKHEVREKYIISSLQLKNLETNLWREVTHLWYVSWPAQGVPEDSSSMIAFLIEARSYMRGAQGPTVVHCSPGTGRTGTVVAIDLCIRDFETLRSVDIPKTVYALRRDRAGSVQTKDQYAFIYKVLNLYATKLTGGALDSI